MLLGMMIDHEIDAIDDALEVVRLNVDHRDAVELRDLFRPNRLDMDVEEVDHPHVLRPGHPLERPDHRGRFRAVEESAQREAAGHRVGIRLVVKKNQDAIGVRQVALILLHARARQRAAEFGQQRRLRTAPTATGS